MSNRPLAFTLVEILLVVALIVAILAFAVPIAWSFVSQNDLDVSATIAAQTLRRAQALSLAGQDGSGWGVEVGSDQVILFLGNSYATRNENNDEVFDLPATVSVSGDSEVDFLAGSGQPTATASIVLTDGLNQARTVAVNGIGAVSY